MITGAPDIKALAREAETAGRGGLPPIHEWSPKHCGDLPIRIRRDGVWLYRDSPINRARLVRLFSTILLRDGEGDHHLVTPVEKVRIIVDDAPFLAVEMCAEGEGREQVLAFRTNVDDWTVAGRERPLWTVHGADGAPSPYVRVRDRLDARLTRAVFYELAERVETHEGRDGVWSGGVFFPLDPEPA